MNGTIVQNKKTNFMKYKLILIFTLSLCSCMQYSTGTICPCTITNIDKHNNNTEDITVVSIYELNDAVGNSWGKFYL